jgi:hypothetical protein
MDAYGRHIMINCVGEGNDPPVSIDSFVVYLAERLNVRWQDVEDALHEYEAGAR